VQRRRLLAASGAALFASVGGCLDRDDSDGGDPATGTGDDEQAATGNGSVDAPAADRDPIETDWPWGPYADREAVDLYAETPDGDPLGGVRAALARTGAERRLGLSDAQSMPEEGGMLFVFDEPSALTFVMRRMDFGLDIVYADADGTITTIRHAPAPGPNEDGSEQEYPGNGQYVLEVNYEWTTRHGVEEGDVLAFELPGER
jgi:uncharacterized membrane protein (UPF0127 family)